ncbi:MAG: hypothetical protein U0X71_00720 [Sphingobacteriaceae bacterium]
MNTSGIVSFSTEINNAEHFIVVAEVKRSARNQPEIARIPTLI